MEMREKKIPPNSKNIAYLRFVFPSNGKTKFARTGVLLT